MTDKVLIILGLTVWAVSLWIVLNMRPDLPGFIEVRPAHVEVLK